MVPRNALACVVFLCLACVGHGRRARMASERMQGTTSSSAKLIESLSQGRVLGLLLLALNPEAGWQSCGFGSAGGQIGVRPHSGRVWRCQLPARCRRAVSMEDEPLPIQESEEQVTNFIQVASSTALADIEQREEEANMGKEEYVKKKLEEQGRKAVKVRRGKITADGRKATLEIFTNAELNTLEAQAEGMKRMAEAVKEKVSVAQPWLVGELPKGGTPFMVTETLQGSDDWDITNSAEFQRELGLAMAALHSAPLPDNWEPDLFGFPFDGYCDGRSQANNVERKKMNYIDFWREFRLKPQVEPLTDKVMKARGEELMEKLPKLFPFPIEEIKPSLLHGNFGLGSFGKDTEKGVPFLSDPACYYGHAEADFGIDHMYGGLSPEFYKAYNSVRPPKPGFELRKLLYQLHYTLNYFNAKGGDTYKYGALDLLNKLLNGIDAMK
mmetsp:Transcript_42275/g.79139  ORF Transcript_42275/g.79139 Transcript_42275/m.79139 type:complete len:441 (+) Transcript_42275:63-1385(+)